MSKFFLNKLGVCPCGKDAIYVVVNCKGARYGFVCKGCGTRRMQELEEFFKNTPAWQLPSS